MVVRTPLLNLESEKLGLRACLGVSRPWFHQLPTTAHAPDTWWAMRALEGRKAHALSWLPFVPGGAAITPAWVEPSGAVVLCASQTDLVPALFIRRQLLAKRWSWEALRTQWPDLETAMQSLDRRWGGSGDLGGVEALLHDRTLEESAKSNDRGEVRKAVARMLILGHRESGAQRLGAFMEELEVDPLTLVPSKVGPWRTLALAWAFDRRLRAHIHDSDTALLAWELWIAGSLVSQAALWSGPYLVPCGIAELSARLMTLMRIIRQDFGHKSPKGADDPWGIALSGHGAEPSGRPFLEASEALLKAGLPAEAWRALTTASHIQLYRQGHVSDDIRRRAGAIAKAARREDLITALERLCLSDERVIAADPDPSHET